MGINPRPPIMSREEFETRKADLWRKRATESVAAKAPAPAATAEKVLKKTNAKASVQKGKILEVVKEVPLDPMAEKLRQESMVGGVEGPDRIFVGGLPYYFTEAQIRELLESFGPLRGFDLVKDRDTGNSKGYGFCVYKDPAATEIACAALNGLKMGDKTLTVRRATMRGRGQGGYVPNKLAATSFASTSIQSIPSFTSKFVPPTTSASTSAAVSASASASASMHEVTSQASYLDTSSTDCCIADTTERKKGRGKSRSLALLKIKSQGKRLDVEICRITGNPLGPWSDKFTTELGIVTRQFAPQNVPKWSFISPEDKETLIAYLREGFIFSNEPYAIASILGMMKLRYKTYRFNLRQHFRSFPTMESALANPHEDIEKEVWRYLCQLWDDKTYQEKCQKNKENRFELKVLHTAGSKAFRKVQYDERDKDGKELGLVDLYHKTHFSQKRQAWVHNEAEIRHKKLKERENEAIEDGSGPLSDEQLSIEVFGRKSGYISGLGRGPKPSTTASGRRTRAALEIENEETRRELEEQRRINEELNARVHNLESNSVEVNAKIDLVLQQISRGGFTSDLPS